MKDKKIEFLLKLFLLNTNLNTNLMYTIHVRANLIYCIKNQIEINQKTIQNYLLKVSENVRVF